MKLSGKIVKSFFLFLIYDTQSSMECPYNEPQVCKNDSGRKQERFMILKLNLIAKFFMISRTDNLFYGASYTRDCPCFRFSLHLSFLGFSVAVN